MYVQIKLIENQEDDLVSGTFYLETYSKAFVDELKKYKCPFRLSKYLTEEENKAYTPLTKPLEDIAKCSLIIELSETTSKIIEEKVANGELLSMIPDTYIESTPHLNKYGNQVI